MQTFRRLRLAALLGAATLAAAACGAPGGSTESSSFPTRTITVISPYPAGGASDILARAVVDEVNANDSLDGEKMQVVNKPGGAGGVGTSELIASEADGYTISIMPEGPVTMTPILTGTEYDPETDLTYMMGLTQDSIVYIVPADSQYNTINELVDAAAANPGQPTIAHAGAPAFPIVRTLTENATGAKFTAATTEGDAASVTAVLGSNVDAALVVASSAKPQIEGGAVKALAVSTDKESPVVPGVPTLKESDIDVSFSSGYIVAGPAGIPDDVLDTLTEAIQEVAEDEEFQQKMLQVGTSIEPLSSAELEDYIAERIELVTSMKDQIS